MSKSLSNDNNVTVLGSVAKAILSIHKHGQVLAVFRRSFYIAFRTDVVCVGSTALGAGPLNALCVIPADFCWSDTGPRPNTQVVCAGATLRVGANCRFHFGDAQLWQAPAPATISMADLRSGLQRLARLAQRWQPGGLGPLLCGICAAAPDRLTVTKETELVLRVAAKPIYAIYPWLVSVLSGSAVSPPQVDKLIGLGGGLTPSCDDFLCGMMTALHYFGRKDLASRLAERVLPVAARDTNLISAAYLRCAAAGHASAALFDALASVASGGGRLDTRLDLINSIGHTSGWDMLAGAVAVCAAITAAPASAALAS